MTIGKLYLGAVLRSIHSLIFLTFALCISEKTFAFPVNGSLLELSDTIEFIEISSDQSKAYVSVPDLNTVFIIDLSDLTVANQLEFDGNPKGLDLNDGETELYVALSETGKVAIVDLLDDDLAYTEVDVSIGLAIDPVSPVTSTFDVERSGSLLFVSADPQQLGALSNLVAIDMANSNSVMKIGTDSSTNQLVGFHNRPVLGSDSSNENLFIYTESGSGFYKVDLSSSGFQIVASNTSDIVATGFKTNNFALSPDETEIVLGNGQVISTDDLSIITNLRLSVPQDYNFILSNGSSHFVGRSQTRERFSQSSFVGEYLVLYKVGQYDVRAGLNLNIEELCNFDSLNRLEKIRPIGNDEGWLLSGEDGFLCYVNEPDTDNDGARDAFDNCPEVVNSDQLNSDTDPNGDLCDDDDDNDGLLDEVDPFPTSVDGDFDGVNDILDAFPEFNGATVDTDSDGKPDSFLAACDASCIASSGLIEDDDDDGDLIPDVSDPLRLIAAKRSPNIFPSDLTTLDLPSDFEFIEPDYARALAYVSVPESNRVIVVSLETLQEVASIEFSGKPTGLDISDDGDTLYVGLINMPDAGSVAVVELDNQLEFTEIELFNSTPVVPVVGDLLEVAGERLFVAARGGPQNDNRLLQVDLLDPQNPVIEVGFNENSNAIERINSRARLRSNNDQTILFVQVPNGFLKLDLTQPLLPILSDGYVDPSGSPRAQYSNVGKNFDISIDETQIITDFGQVIRTSDLKPILDLSSDFRSALSMDNLELFLIENDTLRVLDTAGRYTVASIPDPCFSEFDTFNPPEIEELIEAEDESGWYLGLSNISEGSSKLCFIEKNEDQFQDYPAAGQLFDPIEFFPLLGNVKLPYSVDLSENVGFITTVSNRTTTIRGELTTLLSSSLGAEEFYSRDNSGVYLHRGSDSTFQADYIPRSPISTGPGPVFTETTYSGEIDTNIGDFDLSVRVQIRDFALLELPSGEKIEAFEFLQSQTVRDGSSSATVVNRIWMAKKFGIVQIVSNAFDPDNISVATLITITDADGDNIVDIIDNCPTNANLNQSDIDADGVGNVCDSDDDGDGLPDSYEIANGLNPRDPGDRNTDLDGDGFTNFEEFEFGSDPQIIDVDENDNGIPDAVENRANAIPPVLQLLLDEN